MSKMPVSHARTSFLVDKLLINSLSFTISWV